MSKIQVLDKQVAELIAAGEVVERPASAVKELLENAIDAGATAITLEIKNGGVAFIRVTDNGSGISKEDAPVAFLRHATSKVRSAIDLEAIGTLGFRGEALASISAVSKVELITRTAEELGGTHLRLEGGEIVESGEAGCPRGTTIIIRELFYNTPARMKFLKKDFSEANAVTAVAQRIALSHPEISLRYIKDGREELLTPGDNKLLSAIHAVLGRELAASLTEAKYEFNHLSVSGYISKPTSSRANRNMQYFFLNGRLVKSRTMMAALEEGYKNSIMVGRFPACMLNISMDAHLADINVHPAKLEVRFAYEKDVFDLIYYAVKNTLAELDSRQTLSIGGKPTLAGTIQPNGTGFANFSVASGGLKQNPLYNNPFKANEPSEKPTQMTFDSKPVQRVETSSQTSTAKPGTSQPAMSALLKAAIEQASSREDAEHLAVASSVGVAYTPLTAESVPPVEQTVSPPSEEAVADPGERIKPADSDKDENKPEQIPQKAAPYRVLGQCFGTYIVVEQGEELLLIDKHAAHERILFEQIKAERQAAAQMLLTPAVVTLIPAEHAALLEGSELLEQAGFEAEDFGGSTLLVRAAPLDLSGEELPALITEIAGRLLDHKTDILPEKLDWLYHSVACRAAIKAGDKTSPLEMESLVARVLGSNEIRFCPHGRPVVITLTRREIEKQFGRIV